MLIFRATSLKYCYLHVLNFYLDNGVMTTPKRRILSFVFTVLSLKKSLLIRIVLQTVRRITNEILGVNGLKKPLSVTLTLQNGDV